MKATYKVLFAVALLGVAILGALQLFLQFGLTETLRLAVLPRLKAETGIDATVERLSLNLANGKLHLSGVSVKNPAGFELDRLASIDRVDMDVDVTSLLKKRLMIVKNVRLENAVVNVVRNQAGEYNLDKLRERVPASRSPAPPQPTETPDEGSPPPSRKKRPPPIPQLLVESADMKATIRYLDLKRDRLDLGLALRVEGRNVSTRKDPAQGWGDIRITGALENDTSSFATDVAIAVAPVRDLKNPSFDLKGTVMEIDPRVVDEMYSRLGIRTAPFGVTPDLSCRAGVFKNSRVSLDLADIVFEDKLARRLGGVASVDSLRFPVPVGGTLAEPRVDVVQALLSAVGANAPVLIDSFLKAFSSPAKNAPKGLADGDASDTNSGSALNK